MRKKVLIINSGLDYERMFQRHGWSVVSSLIDADLVQFTGGEDVSPFLYGETEHPNTHHNVRRDRQEMLVFSQAREWNVPQAGICRGGQFLNVMCGGKMYQHVDSHAISGTHQAKDEDTGEIFQVTSTHHQMMIPGTKGKVQVTASLSVTRQSMTKFGPKYTGGGRNNWGDTEAVFYRENECFCFQPHPEFEGHDELAERYLTYISNLLMGGH